MQSTRSAGLTLASAAALLWSGRADSHHSLAPYDFDRLTSIEGIVQEFDIVNPHAQVVLLVSDANGTRAIEYESHVARIFYGAGYEDGSVEPADRIVLLVAPRTDGADGGFIKGFTVAAKGLEVRLPDTPSSTRRTAERQR